MPVRVPQAQGGTAAFLRFSSKERAPQTPDPWDAVPYSTDEKRYEQHSIGRHGAPPILPYAVCLNNLCLQAPEEGRARERESDLP